MVMLLELLHSLSHYVQLLDHLCIAVEKSSSLTMRRLSTQIAAFLIVNSTNHMAPEERVVKPLLQISLQL